MLVDNYSNFEQFSLPLPSLIVQIRLIRVVFCRKSTLDMLATTRWLCLLLFGLFVIAISEATVAQQGEFFTSTVYLLLCDLGISLEGRTMTVEGDTY